MARRKEIAGLNIALLDILTGALGAVIILYVAVPKGATERDKVQAQAEIQIKEKEITKLHAELRSKEQEVDDLTKIVVELEGENRKLKKRGEEQEVELEGMRELAQVKEESQQKSQKSDNPYMGKGLPVDVGFEFKGKYIVFVIDVSGSMYREDRIGQVKAGLKMLITSMPADYHLDVIHFPGNRNKTQNALWGGFYPLESYRKSQVYEFLYKLRARGYTPTRAVLKHVFKNYPQVTDIVLLSDGAPTQGNTNKMADISQLLIDMKEMNKNDVRINTIGVGTAFVRNDGSRAYVFLKELAKDHGGFFYGF